MSVRRLVATTAAPLLVLAAAPSALADDIANTLDTSVDAIAEVMPLNAGGTAGSTTLTLTPTNGDGKNGCNLTGSTQLTLAIGSSNAAVATVAPTSVTFTSCSDAKTLTVTPHAHGPAVISATQVSNTTAGSFDLAPATFRVDVAAPAPSNTAPTLSITGVQDGASYTKGGVPAATCEVADAEDGPSTFPATLGPITGAYAADGIGSRTASCSYTDAGGLTAAGSVTYAIVDASAPVITYALDPADPDGANGWYRGDVRLTWTVTEDESPGSLTLTGCDDQVVDADQAETSYSCAATSAGGTATPVSVSLKRDSSAPNAPTATAVPAANAAGWNNSDVTVTFADNGDNGPSGVSACDAAVVVSADTAGRSVAGACTDAAGNVGPAGSVTVRLDKTAPSTPTFSSLTDGAAYDFGSVPAEPTCDATDALSGLAGCTVSGYSAAVGTHTVSAVARDVAGNTSSSSLTYTVNPYRWGGFYAPVDMNGVLNTVRAGSTVPLKFELFSSAKELTSTALVTAFAAREVSCSSLSTALSDDVEVTTTGGTALRYDATGGQFVQNWKTPSTSGRCYAVSVTTDDGQVHGPALFKLK